MAEGELSKEQIEKTKKASIAEGSSWNVMYGFGEQYVNAFALRLGALSSEIAILSSVPYFLGSLSQVIGAKITDNYKNRKKVVMTFVFLQALTLLPLFFIPLLTHSILLLTIIFSLYLVAGNLSGPGWNSWISDVIPSEERAKYFSKRNKISIIILIISVLAAGMIINYFDNENIWLGFGILFGVATLGRFYCLYLFTKHYEPKYTPEKSELSFRDFTKEIRKTNFGNFVLFRSFFSIAILIGSPFFVVYMLRDLGFSYVQYTAIVLIPMIIKVLTMTYWGRYSDRIGNRNIMFVSILLICLVPLMWFIAAHFFEGKTFIFWFIMFAEAISGFGWAGFELTSFNYMIETSISTLRARLFAYYNVFWGVGILIGGLIGSFLVIYLPKNIFSIKVIIFMFLLSAILRFIVALGFIKKIKEVRIIKNVDERKLFFEIAIARPISSAISFTMATVSFAEEELLKLKEETTKVMDEIIEKSIDETTNRDNNQKNYSHDLNRNKKKRNKK